MAKQIFFREIDSGALVGVRGVHGRAPEDHFEREHGGVRADDAIQRISLAVEKNVDVLVSQTHGWAEEEVGAS